MNVTTTTKGNGNNGSNGSGYVFKRDGQGRLDRLQMPMRIPGRVERTVPTPTASVQTVTPELAQEFIDRNEQNRAVVTAWVRFLADEMSNGRFMLTHQGLAFDWNGAMLDGQHRCHAVIEAQVAVKMLITENLNPATREVIDQGRIRKLSDNLKILLGQDRADLVGGILQMIERAINHSTLRLSYPAAVEILNKRHAAIEWAKANVVGTRFSRGTFSTAPLVAAFVYAYPANPRAVSEAYHALVDGTFSSMSDPLHVLREKIIATPTRGEKSRIELFNKTLGAIHMTLHGEKCKKLQVSKERIDAFKKVNP